MTAATDIVVCGLPLETLAGEAAAEAVGLSAEAGWNQTAADWRLMIDAGRAVGLRTPEGRLVATALVLPLGPQFAWISMVLVTAEYQRRGIATELLQVCIADIEGRGLVPGLDATPAGREVYKPLGFTDILGIDRLHAEEPVASVAPGPPAEVSLRAMTSADLDTVGAFDEHRFGGRRPFLLRHLLARCPEDAWIALRGAAVAGYALARDGRQCHYLGPLVATDEATAIALADRALERIDGPVYIDIVDGHRAFAARLRDRGFRSQRPYTRMLKGRKEAYGDTTQVFALGGPELG